MRAIKNVGSEGNYISSPLWTWNPVLKEHSLWDPFGISLELGKRDIGPYKHLGAIDAKSFNVNLIDHLSSFKGSNFKDWKQNILLLANQSVQDEVWKHYCKWNKASQQELSLSMIESWIN